jgi:DNA polymerase/3'-5' exonuclease PolX
MIHIDKSKIKSRKKDSKNKIIKIFEEILKFHQTLGKKGNIQTQFRISSYEKILKKLKSYSKPIYQVSNINEIEGIGKGTKEKVDEIIKTGKLKMLEDIKKNPEYKAIYEMQTIWGVGVEKAQEIVLEKKIYSISDLKKAIQNGKILFNEQQLKGLEYVNELSEKIPRNEITQFTKWIQHKMNKYGIQVVNAGSYRLGKKESGDIDLLFVKKNIKNHTSYAKGELFRNIIDELQDSILYIFSQGNQKLISILQNPISHKIRQMDILLIDEKELPWYLLYFGSDKEFSKKIRKMAIEKGYKLSEKGLFNRKTGKKIDFDPKDEKEIFTFLKIPYISPSKRI